MAPTDSKCDSATSSPSGSMSSPVGTLVEADSDLTYTSSEADAPEELRYLNLNAALEDAKDEHEVITAPLLTRGAYIGAGMHTKRSQYGVLGSVISIRWYSGIREKMRSYVPEDPRLYINTNAPFSAIVCGVQGSGKSHTVSVLLENMLISGFEPIGLSHKPLSGLVLHFGEGGSGSRPCEAAWVGQTHIEGIQPPTIRVYVSRSSLTTMRATYAPLGDRVKVEPLLFSSTELDAEAVLSMMAVGSSDSTPLYMQRILSILRELGEKFTYNAFLKKVDLAKKDLTDTQIGYLEQRMLLLKAFVDNKTDQSKTRFKAGQLTIIDLSDPFMDASSALLVCQQRHVRSDQGPSVPHKATTAPGHEGGHQYASIAILHRFSSPAWWEAIVKHVSADFTDEEAFDHVTGEAVILAPAGLGRFPSPLKASEGYENSQLAAFGRRYLLARTRRRVTADGGASRMVVEV
ncbi:hypothetical protein ONZ51_g11480 [Trametes cubensis]|uniref:Uncharacterized protein n=1 Tax=Trametes cubensis TaxID=1111947 RepID=A0AAD7X6A9_9APHY|nr:hypothetical protein ONZ51_g11480 [Trametes cubensis]